MTDLGVRVFTAGTAIFGAFWGLVTTGTPSGVIAGTLIAGVLGWFIWDSMRLRNMP
jgi:hypothetical protein